MPSLHRKYGEDARARIADKLGVANRTQAGVLAARAEFMEYSQSRNAPASGLHQRRKEDQASLFN